MSRRDTPPTKQQAGNQSTNLRIVLTRNLVQQRHERGFVERIRPLPGRDANEQLQVAICDGDAAPAEPRRQAALHL